MAARIVHFGTDDFDRLRALRDAGYTVDSCTELSELRIILYSNEPADAVAITESKGVSSTGIISFARNHSKVPLILFQGWASNSNESQFNLVVPVLTPTDTWLKAIGDIIGEARPGCARAGWHARLRTVLDEPSPPARLASVRKRATQYRDANILDRVRASEALRQSTLFFMSEEPSLQAHKVGPFLSSLSHEMLAGLEAISSFSLCAPGTVFFVEGQMPQELFFLLEGQVKIYMNSNDGKRLTVHIAGPGEMLGLPSAFTSAPHRTTAETVYPSRVASVRCVDFLNFLLIHPRAAQAAARELGDLCDHTYTRLRTIGVTPSNRAKLARLLLEWAARGKQTERGMQIHLALKHGEIAECIGTCRESVTRVLRDLQRWRVIEMRGSLLTIVDMSALEQCAGLK